MRHFTIYFDDLNEATQHYFCKVFETTVEEEEEDISPLAIIDREELPLEAEEEEKN